MTLFSYDLETDIIARPRLAPPPVCMSWSVDGTEAALDHWPGKYALETMQAALRNPKVTIIGHNVAFDMACQIAHCPDLAAPVFDAYDAGRVDDTLIRQKLLDNAEGTLGIKGKRFNLETVAARHGLEKDGNDPWRLRYAELRNLSIPAWPQSAVEYSLKDATIPWQIYHRQAEQDRKWAETWGSPILHFSPPRAFTDFALYLMQCWGVRTDTMAVKAFQATLDKRRETLRAELQAAGLVRSNGVKDTKAIHTAVAKAFRDAGKPVPTTDKGNVKADADTLETVAHLDPIVAKIADWNNVITLYNRSKDLANGAVLPLQPRYDSLKDTGRTGAKKGEKRKKSDRSPWDAVGIQIQNNPRARGPRECFAPREGNCFIVADYSTAELHTLGQVHIDLFGRSSLADLLNKGMDVHMKVGVVSFARGECTYEYAKAHKSEKPYKTWRQTAKPIVFGRPGMMGPDRIAETARQDYGIILTPSEVRHIVRVYERIVPELPAYFKWVSRVVDGSHGTIRSLRTGMWRGGVNAPAASNHQFQHLAAAGATAALCAVARECYAVKSSPLYGFRPFAFVHDEIAAEGPIDRARDAAKRLGEVMEYEFNKFTPDCPTPAEPAMAFQWTKDVEPTYNDAGELIFWEPKAA